MRKQISSFTLMVCGIIALLSGFMMLPSPAAVSAQASQPSPRPTLQPTNRPKRDHQSTPVVPGRLTGTVIDLRTGAPTKGIAVIVGDQTVYTDAYGNYDIWLISGYYQVALKLANSQGTSIQTQQEVAVGPGDTVVVHLFFTSITPTEVLVQEPPQVIAPTPTAISTPAPSVALPPSLPDTSVDQVVVAPTKEARASKPQSLPNTAMPASFLGTPSNWLLFGALMLGLGLVIQLAPRRRPRLTASRRTKTTPKARRSSGSNEDFLADLLDRDL